MWSLIHNVVVHPLLALAQALGRGGKIANRFHDWTAGKAWPDGDQPLEGEDLARFNVGALLSEVEQVADEAGFEDLGEALATLHLLWSMGFEDRARQALDGIAEPVREVLATAEPDDTVPDPGAGGAAAAVLLALLLIPAAAEAGTFKRPAWRDFDRDGLNTREEVLVAQCKTVFSADRKILEATCFDRYAGVEVATDSPAQAIQVDHLYAAAVAWKGRPWHTKSGAVCARPSGCEEFARFYNDERFLWAVRSRSNGRKNDATPSGWCPRAVEARPAVAALVEQAAAVYRLPLSTADRAAIALWKRGQCTARARIVP